MIEKIKGWIKGSNWIVAVVAGILVPAGIWAAVSGFQAATAPMVVNCGDGSQCTNLVGITSGENSEDLFGAYAPIASQTTKWTSGEFTDDLTVDDGVYIGGTLEVVGDITGEYFTHISQSAITSVTTTQEICDMTNSDSTPRRLLDAGAQFGTQVTGESTRLSVTSNFGGAATTGTAGTNLLYDYSWTLSTASSTFAASSTAGFVAVTDQTYLTWDPGEHLEYIISSPTTTLTGTCYAVWTSY